MKNKITIIMIVIILLVAPLILINSNKKNKVEFMPELKNINEVNSIIEKYNLEANITYEYSDNIEKDTVI